MVNFQTVISREVRQFMVATSSTQIDIARIIGLDQTAVSRRLLGRSHWSLDDLDALTDAGIVSPLWEGFEERRGMEK